MHIPISLDTTAPPSLSINVSTLTFVVTISLHNVAGDVCATAGLILLEMYGDEAKTNELEQKLKAFEGIEFQKMVFSE